MVVDYNTRRFLSGVSELDRSKYFNIHSTSDDDKDVGKFLADYQVGLGRKFWGPYSYAYNKTHEVGKYPQMKP